MSLPDRIDCIAMWPARLLTVAALVLSTACTAPTSTSRAASIEVRQYGGMREVMREGRTEARVDLVDAAGPTAIGVGALAGLGGEITILDGETWVARVDGSDVRTTGPTASRADAATLLTVADVPAWDRVDLPLAGPTGGAALDAAIAAAARAHGLDVSRPFPFVIEGAVDRLEIHVVNGACPHAPGAHPEGAAPWRLVETESTTARIAGFHASGAAGVLTHHGTAIHAHAILVRDERTITGHVDAVVVRPGAVLLLPRPPARSR